MTYQAITEMTAETIAYMIADAIGWTLKTLFIMIIRLFFWLVPIMHLAFFIVGEAFKAIAMMTVVVLLWLIPTTWRLIIITALLVAFCVRLSVALAINVYRWHQYRHIQRYGGAQRDYIVCKFVGSYA